MKYQLCIFDLDGTILDTIEDLTDSANHALQTYGCPERTTDEIRRFVGNGIRKLVERAVPNGTDEKKIQKIYEEHIAYYKTHSRVKTRPYPGIREMLLTLRQAGMKTAVVSNKADFAVQELIRAYFPEYFDYVVGEKESVRRKPAPDSVNEVLRVLNVPKEDAVYIGDSEVDYETALNADLSHIIVTWGFRDRALLERAGARVFARDPGEICRILGL